MNKQPISPQRARERALFLYQSALERGDFEVVAAVLIMAERDAILERMIAEMAELDDAPLSQSREGDSSDFSSHPHPPTPSPLHGEGEQNSRQQVTDGGFNYQMSPPQLPQPQKSVARSVRIVKGIQETLTIRRTFSPNGWPPKTDQDEEDRTMNVTLTGKLARRNPAFRLENMLVLAAILLIIVALGSILFYMQANRPQPFQSLNQPPRRALAPITPENVDQLQQVKILGHGAIVDLEWSPDGHTLALASNASGIIWLYELGDLNAEPRWLPGNKNVTTNVAFNADGTTLASVGLDNRVRLWDVASGEEAAVFDTHRADTMAFSPDGTMLAGSVSRTIWVWDAATGEDIAALESSQNVSSMAFSPDGTRVVAGNNDGTIQVWEVEGSTLLATLDGHEDRVSSIAFSPAGDMFASGGRDGAVRLWDWSDATGALDVVLQGHETWVLKVVFSRDGKMLASADTRGVVRLWDTETGAEQAVLTGHAGGVSGIAFSPDSKTLASVSADETLRLWDVAQGVQITETPIPRGHRSAVGWVAFSPNSKILASASADSTIGLWDVATGALLGFLEGHSGNIVGADFSPDGTKLVSGGQDGTVRLWDVATGESQVFTGHRGPVYWIDYGPDPNLVVSSGADGTARIWDVTTGESRILDSGGGVIYGASFSPDGKMVVTAGVDGTALWDVATGEQGVMLRDNPSGVAGPWFSPDGTQVMVGGVSVRTIFTWDIATGAARQIGAEGYSAQMWGAEFSPDGRLLIGSGGMPGVLSSVSPAIWFWDFAAGTQLLVLPSSAEIGGMTFSRDGTLLAGAAVDGTVRLWGVAEE